MITDKGFWKGRDVQFASQLTQAIRDNAKRTIAAANALLVDFYAACPKAHPRDATSGWRPTAVNSTTKGASPTSKHMLGLAIDIEDDDEQLDKWLMTDAGIASMTRIGLWMEHPSATPRWAHVQLVAPGSGRRCFYP